MGKPCRRDCSNADRPENTIHPLAVRLRKSSTQLSDTTRPGRTPHARESMGNGRPECLLRAFRTPNLNSNCDRANHLHQKAVLRISRIPTMSESGGGQVWSALPERMTANVLFACKSSGEIVVGSFLGVRQGLLRSATRAHWTAIRQSLVPE